MNVFISGRAANLRDFREVSNRPRKPSCDRPPSLAKLAKIARESGQRIEVTDRPDGSRTVTFGEKASESAKSGEPDEVETWIAKQKARTDAR